MEKSRYKIKSLNNTLVAITLNDGLFLTTQLRPSTCPFFSFEVDDSSGHLKYENKKVAYKNLQFYFAKSTTDPNIVVVKYDGIIFISKFQKNLERMLHLQYFNEFTHLSPDIDLDMQMKSKLQYLLKFNMPLYQRLSTLATQL